MNTQKIKKYINININIYIYIYINIDIYIYMTMVTTSCDLNAPRCITVPRVRLHGSRGVSSLVTGPLGTPVTPRYMKKDL